MEKEKSMTQNKSHYHAIDRREFLLNSAAGALGMIAAPYALGVTKPRAGSVADHATDDALSQGFHMPPSSARPQCFWHWMDGNVTKEGITADLEAMHEIGLGGTLAYDISYQIPFGNVHYMTPEWLEMMRHAAAESKRLGLEMGMHNCSGWSSSGGPWITPEHGMKKLVWSETRIEGTSNGDAFKGKLATPNGGKFAAYYRGIAVLACRNPKSEGAVSLEAAHARISTGNPVWPATPPPAWPGADPQAPVTRAPEQDLNDIREDLDITLPGPAADKPQFVLLTMKQPFKAQSLFLAYTVRGLVICEVQISDDGSTFKTVATANLRGSDQSSITFPQTSSRYYRLFFTGTEIDPTNVHISALDLIDGYRLAGWPVKSGFSQFSKWDPSWDETTPDGTVYKGKDIINVSAFFRSDSTLDWKVPPGDWTILRFGYVPTGRKQAHPEEPSGVGLEVDKLDKSALDIHFEHMTKVMVETMGPLTGDSFTTLLIDSYEVGDQNWTARFSEEFKQRTGYDLIANLPMFTGRVIDSIEMTERVLWDVRKVIADLFTENYYNYFQELCHQYGLKSAIEPYTGPYDLMAVGKAADLPMAEFWTGGSYRGVSARTRMVVSVAHMNDQAITGAEAFTSAEKDDKYELAPYDLKALGDFQFCEGINRFIFHRYALQPWLDKRPGMTMGPWGIHLDRTQTWWKQGHDWITYITRSQFLLQSGKPVADILAFYGEDGESWARWGQGNLPPVPYGLDFEYVDTAHLLAAKVEDDNIILGNGLAYRVLLMPDARYMTLALAQKLLELVKAGAVISSPAPKRTQTFVNFPQDDVNLKAVVKELWGDCNGKTITEHAVGSGKIYWGKPVADILSSLNLVRDFDVESSNDSEHIVYKHRKTNGADIYFVSNQRNESTIVTAKFRVKGKTPELWHADRGVIEAAPVYSEKGDYTSIPLPFDPSGSVFVVFSDKSAVDHVVSFDAPPKADYLFSAAGDVLSLYTATPGTYHVTTAKGRKLTGRVAAFPVLSIDDDWVIHFPPNLGAPLSLKLRRLSSLSNHAEPGVRYFSGTCIYTRDVNVTAAMLAHDNAVFIDLGIVKNLAQVRVNGFDFGVLWKPPFRVDVAKDLKPGRNHIEIEVTNNWANRLIGDEQLPDDCEWIAVPGRGWHLKQWPQWFVESKPRPSQRIAFSTWKFYSKDAPLPDSGLIGPVRLFAMMPVTLSQ
jgi:hypothetical protein